ncbi:MAG TPA: transcriptional regulator GcvA [Xanthomonadales bacterium]|nr:transcriptional regulator GcvA [Xanthomonadales bacterium]
MSARLPPLGALRAFVLAAQHLSFRKAAAELHVTPAAISHQIRGLEEFVGTPLFRRGTRSLYLTDAARAALPALRDAFEQLARGAALLRAGAREDTLTISTAPSFASKWLIPRLGRLEQRLPGVDVRLVATARLSDFARDGIDAAIRFGAGEYPGLASLRLFGESLTPMLVPALARRLGKPPQPHELLGLPLLHDDSVRLAGPRATWSEWFRQAGVTDARIAHGTHIDDGHLALQAAAAGRGALLGREVLGADDLEAGVLVAPFERRIELAVGYHLVVPEGGEERPLVAALRDWLLEESTAFAARNAVPPAPRRKSPR